MTTWLIILVAALVMFLIYSHFKSKVVVVKQSSGSNFGSDLGALANAFTSIYSTVSK
jgi:hypothetical protein